MEKCGTSMYCNRCVPWSALYHVIEAVLAVYLLIRPFRKQRFRIELAIDDGRDRMISHAVLKS
ncbi:unnamed protein product [Eruca vesicaria subsp. sativa]|uniref:Uncharacterized protein n=1 Tax=Eruca vesicaria subsp. sativa TaxID=29727 RepID=A0ABC8M8G7_ERUVS|nr:unnamed protein product [Eruca vesicaria subsp. sativa]